MRYAVYDPATGEIFRAGTAPNPQDQPNAGEALFLGPAADEIHYIDPATGERQNKRNMLPVWTIGTGTVTVSNLPVCQVRVDRGAWFEVTDSTAEITVDVPGTYLIEIAAGPQVHPYVNEVEIP